MSDYLNYILFPQEAADGSGVYMPWITGLGEPNDPTRVKRSDYNELRTNEDGTARLHGALDIMYYKIVPPDGKAVALGDADGINAINPDVGSPVSGYIENYIDSIGGIIIVDSNGNKHTLLHLNEFNVDLYNKVQEWRNDPTHTTPVTISAGQIIGKMGKKGAGVLTNHVHYEIETKTGKPIDPEAYWDSGLYKYDPDSDRITIDLRDLTPEERSKLLDLIKDKPSWFNPFDKKINMIDPLVLDLNGDGVKSVDINDSNVYFDLAPHPAGLADTFSREFIAVQPDTLVTF